MKTRYDFALLGAVALTMAFSAPALMGLLSNRTTTDAFVVNVAMAGAVSGVIAVLFAIALRVELEPTPVLEMTEVDDLSDFDDTDGESGGYNAPEPRRTETNVREVVPASEVELTQAAAE